MNREELEKLLQSDLIDLVLKKEHTIEVLQARITQLEIAHIRARGEHPQHRVFHHHYGGYNYQYRRTNYRTVIIILIGIILTFLIVLYMNGYFPILFNWLLNLIRRIIYAHPH